MANSRKPELLIAVVTEDATESEESAEKSLVEQHQERLKEKNKKSSSDPLQDAKERERKLREVCLHIFIDDVLRLFIAFFVKALKAQELEEKRNESLLAMDERSRPYNSSQKHSYSEPTDEEMEAYQMKKRFRDDPMAAFISN